MEILKINKERIKQISLSIIAFSLILVGYLNYNLDENKSIEVSSKVDNTNNEVNLGDVQLVNSEPIISENNTINSIVSNDNINENTIESNSVVVSENYFEETKIQRDKMYSEMLETYQNLVDSRETPADQKAIAAQEISNLANIKNGIMISENLIKNKGFENVVILVNNGKVSIVVKSPNLTQDQISKIQNIVERELNVEISNISISNK